MIGGSSLANNMDAMGDGPEVHDRNIDDILARAADGSDESQYKAGLHFESLAKSGIDKEANAIEAVHWLIQASKQCHVGATEKLSVCTESGFGITKDNKGAVQWCVDTNNVEKKLRSAARNMFRSINPLARATDQPHGNGGKFEPAILEITDEEKKILENSGIIGDIADLTEDEFVERISEELEKMRAGEADETKVMEEFENLDFTMKIVKYPGLSSKVAIDFVIENASVTDLLLAMVPVDQIFVIVCFILYSLVSIDMVTFTIPLFVFYMSLGVMITSTLQMFKARRRTRSLTNWSNVLTRFQSSVAEDTESKFRWSSMRPYWSFFIGLMGLVITFSMTDKGWIPCSELSMISFFLSACCFTALSDHHDHFAIAAMVLELISNISSFIDKVPENHWATETLEILVTSWYKIEVYDGTYIDISVPSVSYMLIGLTFLRLAMMNNGQGVYKRLIPHLVCFFWWQVGVMLYRYATWFGFARACVGWLTILLLLPLFGAFIFCWVIYYSWYMLTHKLFLRYATTCALVLIPTLVIIIGLKLSSIDWSKITKRAKMILGISCVVLLVSALSGGTIYAMSDEDVDAIKEIKLVDWDTYDELCGKSAWAKTNIADVKIKCAHFVGAKVAFKGRINDVDVNIENSVKKILDSFPTGLAEWFKCAYGQRYNPCSKETDPNALNYCRIRSLQPRACHVQNQNSYTFKVKVQILEDDSLVTLIAGDSFKAYMLSAKVGHEISFHAKLKDNIGGRDPILQLTHVHSERSRENENDFDRDDVTEEETSLLDTLIRSLEFMSDFLLFPLVIHE
ncbi:unnamed protein product [Owenia fusiformis]|uniref:Uncharacterized protein n=1 Tax=Owenia fusiformis TaxID=6347 RepID=A0A8J1TZI0_OWEFU|nr:unnamed protein product [Owenia fusiformis]